ncbi:hypothetical protein AcW1_001325 [Taiwanofungus camphoratus]|nr:hypothetical protein AcW2_000145 [Antrodia cinnamomea]KAI0962522.1 hypothetical protein AcV7_001352 [Antrodia cinnamomea]KAI0964523.1 hypothetical protein AcW1_001325 [Antrodia cinnamomea]
MKICMGLEIECRVRAVSHIQRTVLDVLEGSCLRLTSVCPFSDGLELAVLPLYRIVHVTQIMTGVRLYELYLAEDVLLVVAGGFAPECKLTMLYTASRHGALLRDA